MTPNFQKIGVKMASRGASERLLQQLEASQRLGMALDIHGARVRPAILTQKSLPESRRVAPGTPPQGK